MPPTPTTPGRLRRARIVGDRPSRDDLSLKLACESGGGAAFDRVELVDSTIRVEIGVVEQGPNGPRTLELRYETTTVVLARPLGERKVIDATSGKRLRRGGARPL